MPTIDVVNRLDQNTQSKRPPNGPLYMAAQSMSLEHSKICVGLYILMV